MENENNTNKSDFSENEIPDQILRSPLYLNQKQTSEILTVAVVMKRKRKVLNLK